MPERALLSSPLGSRTPVHSPRGLLGKTRPAVRYCSLQCRLERRRSVGLMPDRREVVALFRLTAVVYDWLALYRDTRSAGQPPQGIHAHRKMGARSATVNKKRCQNKVLKQRLFICRKVDSDNRFLNGGGRWIRTTESDASRFTVCPL